MTAGESVDLSKTSISLVEGDEMALSATVKPDDASDKKVTWTSSKEEVATVSAEGLVKAVKEGEAVITAKAGEKTAECRVTVSAKKIPVTMVMLNKESLTLMVGDEEKLVATIVPENATDQNVQWSSSNTEVATVDQEGLVKALKEGESKIVAYVDGKTAECAVTVEYVHVSEICLDKTSESLYEGEKVTITATLTPEDATYKEITWSSSDPAVASVEQGVVTAIKKGTATITATANGKSASCAIEVLRALTAISLEPSSLTLHIGDETTLTTTYTPQDATLRGEVSWTSSNSNVAKVDDNGTVKAIEAGTTVITVSADGLKADCPVTVEAEPLQILIIRNGIETRSSGDFINENPVVEGAEVSVNGISYTLERMDNGELSVSVPPAEWYEVSIPSGAVASEDHQARVTTTIDPVSTEMTAMPWFGLCAPYEGMDIPNPATVTMTPCLSIIQINLDETLSGQWGSVELSTLSQDEYLAGTASYVLNEDDINLIPGLNPNIEFSGDKSRTVRINSTESSTAIYIPTFPQTLTQGFSLVLYDKSGNKIAEKIAQRQMTFRAGSLLSLGRLQGAVQVTAIPDAFDGNKRASTTYQLLIYTFADSDGDGVGDFKGIQNKLDYLDELGVSALWLSPAHPASSYHGYDVEDYNAVNPLYGTESDFRNLIEAAHNKGIKIYMDYVLNHTSKFHPWFQNALASSSSPYRDYYFFSTNPSADYKNFPMLKGTTYQSGEWKQATSGSPKFKITKTSENVTNGNASWNIWTWQDGGEGKAVKFVDKGDGTYYLVMDINGKRGFLVRKYNNWNSGSKFGANTATTLTEGTPVDLVAEGSDMYFTGSGRYKIELTNVSTETLYYMGCFSDWMPDLNYGDVNNAENNACFKDLAASADKWINLGVDGFRLDAVKHICGGINSYNNTSNQTLLKKWYDHCNATYKASGHADDIFMVAEAWDGHDVEKNYYKALTSCFEFDYGYKVRDMLNNGSASGFVSSVSRYLNDHTAQRSDAVTSFFLSNHDQDRFASSVNRNDARIRQAAAILLTCPGKPFIYQGEELGYWGTKSSGDEYVRTPVMWNRSGTDCAKKGVDNKVNSSMLTSNISVEAQLANEESLLQVYKAFSRARNTYPALAEGTMTSFNTGSTSVAAWMMTSSDGDQLLVLHNVSSSEITLTLEEISAESMAVALLGKATISGHQLTMGANSSVVFKL